MSSAVFGWIAIAAIVLSLYLPSEARRSAPGDSTTSDDHGLAKTGPQDSPDPSLHDFGSEDSRPDDAGTGDTGD
jgi:hypothetical protein